MQIDSNGDLFVAGHLQMGGGDDDRGYLVKIDTSAESLDASLDSDGVYSIDFGDDSYFRDLEMGQISGNDWLFIGVT